MMVMVRSVRMWQVLTATVAVSTCRQSHYLMIQLQRSHLAGETGFEPATPGFGGRLEQVCENV